MSIISGLLNNTITSINSVTRNAYGDTTRTIVYSDVVQITELRGGKLKGVSVGATYRMNALPKVLQGVQFEAVDTATNFESSEGLAA